MLFKCYTSPCSGIQVSKRTLKIPVTKFQMHKLFFYISHGHAKIPTRSYVYYHYWGEDMSLWYMLVGRRWIMLSNTRNLLEDLNYFLSVWTSFSSSYSMSWKWSVSYCYWAPLLPAVSLMDSMTNNIFLEYDINNIISHTWSFYAVTYCIFLIL